jgi:hypothetical protein
LARRNSRTSCSSRRILTFSSVVVPGRTPHRYRLGSPTCGPSPRRSRAGGPPAAPTRAWSRSPHAAAGPDAPPAPSAPSNTYAPSRPLPHQT